MAEFVEAESCWRSTCCNPFEIRGHNYYARKKSLRPVAEWMCKKKRSLQIGMKICDSCRKKLADALSDSSTPTSSDSPSEMHDPSETCTLGVVNQCLVNLGQTPVTKRNLQSKTYSKQKLESLTTKMGEVMLGEDKLERQQDEIEMLQQLKDKFHSTQERSAKVQILTVLPQSWSVSKIQAEFGACNFMARKAKQLVRDKGVLSSPDPRPGRQVSQETFDHVVSFYEDDEYSR